MYIGTDHQSKHLFLSCKTLVLVMVTLIVNYRSKKIAFLLHERKVQNLYYCHIHLTLPKILI